MKQNMLKNADYIYDNIIIADEKNTTKKYCKKTTGVDLSVKDFYEIITPGVILQSRTKVGRYERVDKGYFTPLHDVGVDEAFDGWYLPKGTYICELNEGCRFGENDVGYIILRSSLNRNGVSLVSAVWDSSFTTQNDEGEIFGMSVRLIVDCEEGIYIEENARVGQLLVFEAPEGAKQYGGEGHQFQGKGLK